MLKALTKRPTAHLKLPESGKQELKDRALMDAKVRLYNDELTFEEYEQRVELILKGALVCRCPDCGLDHLEQLAGKMGPDKLIRVGGSPLLFARRRALRRKRKAALEWHTQGPKPSSWLMRCKCGREWVAKFASNNPYRF